MKELMAELLECTCIQQGREALAEQIIEKHTAKLFPADSVVVDASKIDASVRILPGAIVPEPTS